jgi:hypothetical protein
MRANQISYGDIYVQIRNAGVGVVDAQLASENVYALLTMGGEK